MAMAQAQDQQRKKSATDYANSAYSTIQNVKTIAETAKKIQMAASAISAAISTSEIWIPALIIGGIFLLIVVFFMVISGQNNSAVPNGVNAQPGPSPTISAATDILSWAQQIDDNVTKLTCSSYRNVMLATVTNGKYTVPKKPGSCSGEGFNTFFCTDLVSSAYRLTGISKSFSRTAGIMAQNWNPQVQLITGQNVFSLISPGDAIFPACSASPRDAGHAALIFSVSINSNGAGTITTIDTNTPSEYSTLRVRGWTITTAESIDCGISRKPGIAHYFWLGQQ